MACQVDVIETLVELGAAREARDYQDRTALHLAASDGVVSVIQKLVEVGAAREARDAHGATALLRAAKNGHVEAIQKLVELGSSRQPQVVTVLFLNSIHRNLALV